MALPGITCPEKYLVPLYFRPEDQGELGKLFQKDSIFEHLWDPWKAEAVKAVSYEDISLIKYMHSHFLSLKSPIFATLKQAKERLVEIFKHLISDPDVYSIILQDIFIKNLSALDNDIMISILKYYAILEEHKRIAQVKSEHLKSAITLKIEIEKFCKKISNLSLSLNFETLGGIKLTKLEPGNPQFSRCDKAICDNIRASLFKDSQFSSLKLCAAFKIENSQILKSFEKKLKKSEGCLLKGLFLSVDKNQVAGLSIFGLQTVNFVKTHGLKEYYQQYFRLPLDYRKKTKIEKSLKMIEGFEGEIYASQFSTLVKDEKKIMSDNNCVVILVLCRAILPRNKHEAGLNHETQEYKISDFSMIYPEYILVCTKEKCYFEVVPTKYCVIPVKLVDLNYANQSSNKMNIEGFYTHTNKAFEQSQSQRNKLRSDIASQIDNFWGTRFKKDALVNNIIENKKRFAERLKAEIDTLRKDLSTAQRFTDSLKQIKNIRFK